MRRIALLSILATCAFPLGAMGQEVVRESIPQKWFTAMVPEEGPLLSFPSYFNRVERARGMANAGRYKLALQTLAGAAPPAGWEKKAALVKVQSLHAVGRIPEAIDLLTSPILSGDADADIWHARLLEDSGQLAPAIQLLRDLVKADPQSIAARFRLGQLSERAGDYDTAREMYGWFADEKQNFIARMRDQGSKAFEHAEEVVVIGQALDRWATLEGVYPKIPNLHDTILSFFTRAYDEIDRGYWPAHVAAAEYFLSHDNSFQALKELELALAANPADAKALDLLGRIMLDQFNFDGADQAVASLRRVDVQSVVADLLQARNMLRQRRPKEAARLAQGVLDRKKDDLEATGLLAAAEALQLREPAMKELLARVDQINPHDAAAYLEVAEQLAAMRQYPRAAAMYKIAIDRAPWWTTARNGLGLLYTQSGDEDLARTTLEAAHNLDEFNLATTNYLRLLDDLAGFEKKESAHFIVFYDGKTDPIIPEYFTEYLESIYGDVCGEFQFEPGVKTYIEVFPTHDAFSVRTTGSPWIGTVGASTGRVIALVSPRSGQNTMGAFNWAQVLRHEFTHTVTLGATDNRIAHWMTEGLAVQQERSPLQWAWVPMLYNAVSKKTLFDMDQLTWAFVRPKKPSDRQMAYAESFWVCQYLTETYGHEAVLKMLAEFRVGTLQEDVFVTVLGRSQGQFFTEFSAWAQKQVAGWGYDKASSEKYETLRSTGEELIKARDFPAAAKIWEEIAKLRPVDQLPHQRLAGLYLAKAVNQPEKAIEHLTILSQVDIKDNRYAKRIARIFRDQGKQEKSIEFAMLAIHIDPYDVDAHELMRQLQEKAGNGAEAERSAKAVETLKKLAEQAKRDAGAAEN